MNVTLLEPSWLLLVSLLVPIMLVWHRRQSAVSHSKTGMHRNLRSFSLVGKAPIALFVLAWTCMCIAMARPADMDVSTQQAVEARDIIVAVDISSSMDSTMDGGYGSATKDKPRKLDIARESVQSFIIMRDGDRIALLAFSDDTYYFWPLSSDQALLLRKIKLLTQTVGGTNFDGPSSSDSRTGPIQAAIDHFRAYGQSDTKVLVLVTDGEATISPQRFAALSRELEKMGVHLYVIGVGEEWTSGSTGTQDLRKFVTAMHGTIITAGSTTELQQAMAQISGMERSAVKLDTHVEYDDIYPPFVLASIFFWMAFLVLNAATRRIA